MVLYIIVRVVEEENGGESIFTEILRNKCMSLNIEETLSVLSQNNR